MEVEELESDAGSDGSRDAWTGQVTPRWENDNVW